MLISIKHPGIFMVLILISGLECSDSFSQVRSGYRGGINLTTMTISNNGNLVDTEVPVGLHFGMMYEVPFTRNFSFQTGFLLSSKGTDYKIDNKSCSIAPTYFELPAHSALYFGRRDLKISLVAGPYFSTAIGGYLIESTGWKDLTFGNKSEKDLRLFDIGMDVGISLNISDFVISFQYGHGLRNISPKDELLLRNKVVGISVGTLIRQD